MFHEGLTDVSITLTALIVTGIGIFIALLFNIKAIKQNSKNQEYQMKKDFYEKFHEIQKIDYNKPGDYITQLTNFAIMVWDLHKDGIVKKETITSDLKVIFEESMWFFTKSNIKFPEPQKDFQKWCKENKIKITSPSSNRLEHIKSKFIVGHKINEEQIDNTETTKKSKEKTE